MGSPPPVSNPLLSSEAPLSDHSLGSQSPKSAWSSPLAEVSSSQAKPVFALVNGVARVSIPSGIVDEGVPLWRNFMVGYFMGDAPHVGTIHATVNRIWNTVGRTLRIDVQVLNETTVLFRIDNAQSRSRMLRRRYWHIADIPLVVNEWSLETVQERPNLSAMPLWVDLKGVPGNLYSQVGLRLLADITGSFVKLHPNTERCIRLDVTRVLVEVDLEKPLTEEICLEGESGNTFNVKVCYPWLPPRCNGCLGWGHKAGDCTKSIEKQRTILMRDNVNEQSSGQRSAEKPVEVVKNLFSELGSLIALPVTDLQSERLKTQAAVPQQVQAQRVEAPAVSGREKDAAEGWSVVTHTGKTVSPRKTQNLPNAMSSDAGKHDHSPTGFRVLADIQEEGEIIVSNSGLEGITAGIVEDLNQASRGKAKGASKKAGQPKPPKRPILNVKDLIQSRPQNASKKASSRKF